MDIPTDGGIGDRKVYTFKQGNAKATRKVRVPRMSLRHALITPHREGVARAIQKAAHKDRRDQEEDELLPDARDDGQIR